MGSVHSYETGGGKRYQVRFRRPDRSQGAKRGFKTKREAETWLREYEIRRASGSQVDPSSGRVTIAVLGERWLQAKRGILKPSSFAPVEIAWRLRVKPRWGNWPVNEIRFTDVRAWVAELRGEAGATVVLRTIGVLAGILDDAVQDERITRNPARGGDIGKPKKTRSLHRYLSHEQVRELADAAGEKRLLVLVLAYTGMRWAEVTGLRIGDLDVGRGRIHISQNAVEVAGVIHVGTPKSHIARSVPVPAFIMRDLDRVSRGKPLTDLVFPGRDGGHMRRVRTSDASKSWFKAALKRAGLPPMTLHDLRHTAASLAVQSGAHVKTIQRMLGHASAAMTLDVYADLFDGDLDNVAHALDAAARPHHDIAQPIAPASWPQRGL
ncbi:tyrosine-type recombinase/integrase [Microbacterium sp. NPDC057407]|uniref:site-specific integrase n=1 Tax=Microbacterium sp. NPDC057407 TaxID=3346120 RepID=UPI003670E74C